MLVQYSETVVYIFHQMIGHAHDKTLADDFFSTHITYMFKRNIPKKQRKTTWPAASSKIESLERLDSHASSEPTHRDQ